MSCQRILPGALAPGDHVRESHHLHLDPVPRLVSLARRFVLEHAPDLPPETRDSLQLLTSELVTNAVLHARTEIELGITVGDASVVVTVSSASDLMDAGRVIQRFTEEIHIDQSARRVAACDLVQRDVHVDEAVRVDRLQHDGDLVGGAAEVLVEHR